MPEPANDRSRKRRLDAERSRAAVLDAAITVLGRRADASVEDIAAAAGVVRQTVYAHFPSRGALVGAMIESLTTEVANTLAALDLETPPADEALRQWLDASWSIIKRFPVLLSPVITEAAPPADEHHRHQPVTAQLVDLVRRGQRARVFQTHQPETWIVTAVVALGHAAGAEVTAGRMSPDEAGTAYRDSVLRLVVSRTDSDNG